MIDAHPPFELAHPGTELRRQLVAAVLVEVTDAKRVPASEIDVGFARDEGEGFESVEDWRIAYEHFFQKPVEPDTEIVAIRFRVAERL